MNYQKIPDKEKQPFTYQLWKDRGLFNMKPEERVLMDILFKIKIINQFIFGIENWWDTEDMKNFVKDIVPKIIKEYKKRIKKR
ncbi:MAG: hypothetical protein J7L15_03020 [Clostridiales bacterium]|nr:hypothetical protein [Clostridiales bacterium]